MTDFDVLKAEADKVWDDLQSTDGVVYLGTASCGIAAGIGEVKRETERWMAENGADLRLSEVGCIGTCCFEPLVSIQVHGNPPVAYGPVEGRTMGGLLDSIITHKRYPTEALLGSIGDAFGDVPSIWDHPVTATQKRIITENNGIIDPVELEHYISQGGFEGLKKALAMTPDEVIETVLESGLRGRGGAGFPSGRKWQMCRQNRTDKSYMVCNADEGDPGAFMDRSILEGDPYRLLEGLTTASYAIGADEAYIYARAEYPLAIKRLRIAIAKLEEVGFLGEDIMGSGFSLSIHIKEGAGAFVCGEETALLASIEGKRGMPRPRPPYPAQEGLWGKPTVINNVKSLASVPAIMRLGAEHFASIGSEGTKGTAVFALTGKVKYPGLVEVPMGTTIREIVEGIGGGVPDGGKLKAVQTGGPSGGCIPESMLDLPVDFESLQQAGAIMGSGGMVVMDEETCMVDVARYFISFTQYESCGKCPPCRIGTKKMKDILERICDGNGDPGDIEVLEEIGSTVRMGSLCQLGGTAPNPVLSTIKYFREEYEAHISDGRCPAAVCKPLVTYTIEPDECIGCTLCAKNCPVSCIAGAPKEAHVIDQHQCVKCGMCHSICPKDAVKKTSPGRKEVVE